MPARRYYLYILANSPKGVLYVGSTGNLARRMSEHKGKHVPGFMDRSWKRVSASTRSRDGTVRGRCL